MEHDLGILEQDPPIQFRGTSFRAAKGYAFGTHRTRPPEETWRLIEPYLATAGVTRVADITGLDNVGIPTTLALRPNAPTMACSSGKGLTKEAAFVSGAMEAIELHAAETASLRPFACPYGDLPTELASVPAANLPLTRGSLFNPHWAFHWVSGWDLIQQKDTAVPLATVVMSRSRALIADLGAFLMSSNGLASGNTFAEAATSALYEVVERDGVACHRAAWAAGANPSLLSRSILEAYPIFNGVLGLCASAGVDVRVVDCTTDLDVPTYLAYVFNTINEGIGVYRGYGAHLDPEIAIVRAVTEALQGRLNFIAGSRDDIFRSAYWRVRTSNTGTLIEALDRDCGEGQEAPARQSASSLTFEGDVHAILRRLYRCGLKQAVLLDLTPDDCPVHVVRAVVPGLEGYMHYGYRPGVRATRFAARVSQPCA